MTRLDKVTAVKFLYFCILTYCEAPEKNSNLYVFEAKVYALDKDMKPLRHTTLLSLFENLQPLECKVVIFLAIVPLSSDVSQVQLNACLRESF
jgi:hypothetical protein